MNRTRPATALVLALAALAPSGLAAYQAAATAPIPGWGEPVDPSGDCTIRFDESTGTLTITVPGAPHDLLPQVGKRNAPRVVRDIEGNHAATVRVAGDLDAGGAGLLLWQDERNFVRLERSPTAPGGIAFEYWRDGQPQVAGATTAAAPAPAGPETWLRLTRRIDRLRAEVSGDGETWAEVATIPIRLSSRLSLGVLAVNPTAEPLEARFAGFAARGVPLYPTAP